MNPVNFVKEIAVTWTKSWTSIPGDLLTCVSSVLRKPQSVSNRTLHCHFCPLVNHLIFVYVYFYTDIEDFHGYTRRAREYVHH